MMPQNPKPKPRRIVWDGKSCYSRTKMSRYVKIVKCCGELDCRFSWGYRCFELEICIFGSRTFIWNSSHSARTWVLQSYRYHQVPFCSPSVRFGPPISSTQDSGSSMLVGPKAEAWGRRDLQETSGNIGFNTPNNLKTKSPGGFPSVFPVAPLWIQFRHLNFWPGASNCRHAGC